MKRILSFALALVVVLSMSAMAFADTGSVVATPTTETGAKASALPTVAEKTDATLTAADDVKDLPEEAQKAFKDAQKALDAAVPEGMEAQYFFYAESKTLPYDLTIKMANVKDAKDFAGKLFVDGKWVDLKYVLNDDGTITVTITDNGPVAFFVTK